MSNRIAKFIESNSLNIYYIYCQATNSVCRYLLPVDLIINHLYFEKSTRQMMIYLDRYMNNSKRV